MPRVALALALALVAVAVIGIGSPLLASSASCAEDGGTDCCGLDCALCLCCSHGPQVALGEAGTSGGELLGGLGPEDLVTPREPLPRDILHVPRPVSVS